MERRAPSAFQATGSTCGRTPRPRPSRSAPTRHRSCLAEPMPLPLPRTTMPWRSTRPRGPAASPTPTGNPPSEARRHHAPYPPGCAPKGGLRRDLPRLPAQAWALHTVQRLDKRTWEKNLVDGRWKDRAAASSTCSSPTPTMHADERPAASAACSSKPTLGYDRQLPSSATTSAGWPCHRNCSPPASPTVRDDHELATSARASDTLYRGRGRPASSDPGPLPRAPGRICPIIHCRSRAR